MCLALFLVIHSACGYPRPCTSFFACLYGKSDRKVMFTIHLWSKRGRFSVVSKGSCILYCTYQIFKNACFECPRRRFKHIFSIYVPKGGE